MSAPAVLGTANQIIAANPKQSVWVSANAGTGKTRVLVDRISRLLLAGTAPGRILCLTFTKAAAAEMANRLSARLSRWSAIDHHTLVIDLQGLLNRTPSDVEMSRAQMLFAETLDASETLNVRTVHSFCESLLGRFPLEAGLAPQFTVIDERAAHEWREKARDRVLARTFTARGSETASALQHLAGLTNEDRFAQVMQALDSNRHQFHTLLKHHGTVSNFITYLHEALDLNDGETRLSALTNAASQHPIERADLERLAEAWSQGAASDQAKSSRLRGWLAKDAPARTASYIDDFSDLFMTAKLEPRSAGRLVTKGAQAADANALEIAMAQQENIATIVERLRAIDLAEATAALVRVGAELLGDYAKIKEARGLLDYDDLIERARLLLESDSGVSWVHYKLDGGIDHVLVDEAQDTSPQQWDIIKRLTVDFFAGSGRHGDMVANSDKPRTVFAVGDEKQSIFSFQGADPASFAETEVYFRESATAAHQDWRPVEMAESFRSVPVVLQLVDKVFGNLDASDGLTATDRPVRHISARQGQAGLVELWPTMKPEDALETGPWDAPLDQLAPGNPQVRLAEKIADTISDWIVNAEVLESANRPIQPGDVMILLRKRGTFAEELVRALKARSVPVAGRDRMILTDHLAVQDLIALGRFAILPDDDLNTATVLKGPFLEFNEEQLFDLAQGRAGTLWAELRSRQDQSAAYANASNFLSEILRHADAQPPFEFFSHRLGNGGREALQAHLGAEATDPVDEFLSLTLEFERQHPLSLEGFLNWIEIGEVEVKRDLEQGADEVRVMTVHGAKGLQAEIVILPDTCSLPGAQSDSRVYWSDDDLVLWPAFAENEEARCRALKEARRTETLQEYRRLLYVALTRAKDRLYVAGLEGQRAMPDDCWYRLIEDAMQEIAEPVDTDGSPVLRVSEPQIELPDAVGMELALAGGMTAIPEWAHQDAPDEPTPTKPLAPSRPDDEPPVASPLDEDGNRFKRGRLIHALLQTLPEVSEHNREAAAAAFLAEPSHDLAQREQVEIAREVLSIMESAAIAPIFGPGSRAEVPIAGDIGTNEPCVISGQVDRLLVEDDKITVIDFKTNRPPPDDEKNVAPVYLRQMAAYRAALRQIYPNREIATILLWTDGPRLMPLSDQVLDPHAP